MTSNRKHSLISIPILSDNDRKVSSFLKSHYPNLHYDKQENLLSFYSKESFIDFITKHFKVPGTYEYNETTIKLLKKPSLDFETQGTYTTFLEGGYDYISYWESEKQKILNGVLIIDTKRGKDWYFSGLHYFWLNFLKIYNKEKKQYTFPDLRDVQTYMSLYLLLAELNNKNAVIVKKRQISASYLFSAELIRKLWFYEGSRNKLLAYSEKPYLYNTWDYIEGYKQFLNTYTAWYRQFMPEARYNLLQQFKVKQGGRVYTSGLMSSLIAKSMSEDPTGGVGGGTTFAFYEEAGIAPTLHKTYEYLLPAMKEGELITGTFLAAGSVGSVEDCEPLKRYIYNPETYDFYAIDNSMLSLDESGTEYSKECKKTGCFIPQQWGMKPFIDDYGNSLVEDAFAYLIEQRKVNKNKLSYDEYRIRVSQSPITLEEVFMYKKQSRFNVSLIVKHLSDIANGKYPPYETYDLIRDKNTSKVSIRESTSAPILEFPIKPNTPNKEGAVQIWEKPMDNVPFGTYIAGVDPVTEGKTYYSDSLASIYIMRRSIMVESSNKGEGVIIKPSSLVACWTGRYDNLEDTNDQMLKLIEYYNAVVVCEANIPVFIQYMLRKKQSHRLIRRNQMIFFKEQETLQKTYNEFGWKNTGDIFSKHMIEMFNQYINEVIDNTNIGDRSIDIYGITRIRDRMVFEELLRWEDGLNTDRVIALVSAIAYMMITDNNGIVIKTKEKSSNDSDYNSLLEGGSNRIGRYSYFNNIDIYGNSRMYKDRSIFADRKRRPLFNNIK